MKQLLECIYNLDLMDYHTDDLYEQILKANEFNTYSRIKEVKNWNIAP